MKRLFLSIGLLALFIFSAHAQNSNDQNQIIVIQKETSEDGSVTVKKKRFDKGEDPETYIEELKLNDNGEDKKLEFTVITDGSNPDDAETILFIRNGGKEEVVIKSNGNFDDDDFDFDFDFDFDDDNVNYEYNHKHKSNKALVGIYPEKVNEGVLITSLVYGGGARAAGMKAGDIMTSIDGKSLSNGTSLRQIMSDYQPGDVIAVDFLRGDQTMTTNVTLTERGKTETKNPCKVFIGVSLGSSHGEGIRISGIIDGWPAEEMALESGDRILAMDGVRVEDFDDLLVERNKHEAGDEFALTILRDGNSFEVDGQFKECPEDNGQVEPQIKTEPSPEPEQEPEIEFADNFSLELGGFNAYPNPTAGMLNIRFRGEPVPTVVTVADVTGQQLFQQSINDFDGYFAQEVNLSNGTPGVITVTVRQGDKVQTKQVILLSRA